MWHHAALCPSFPFCPVLLQEQLLSSLHISLSWTLFAFCVSSRRQRHVRNWFFRLIQETNTIKNWFVAHYWPVWIINKASAVVQLAVCFPVRFKPNTAVFTQRRLCCQVEKVELLFQRLKIRIFWRKLSYTRHNLNNKPSLPLAKNPAFLISDVFTAVFSFLFWTFSAGSVFLTFVLLPIIFRFHCVLLTCCIYIYIFFKKLLNQPSALCWSLNLQQVSDVKNNQSGFPALYVCGRCSKLLPMQSLLPLRLL